MNRKIILMTIATIAISSFILLSFTTEKSADERSEMVADWERAKAYTQEYLNAANDEVIGFKPTPEMRSFGEQMLHLAEANYAFSSAASGKQNPITRGQLEKGDQYKTKEAVTKAVLESYDFAIASLKGLDKSKMEEMIKVFDRFEMNRGTAFRKAFEHQTHHRGQTTVYLRLKGLTPPNEKLF
jgi:uncharacterized damage-inducible protein DinB